MQAIIGLFRRGYTGKTDTLNLLIDLLEASASPSPMPQPQPEGHDRRKVVRYRGLTVGVCTPGDTEDEVRENRDFFEQHACDVGVTAARSWGRTHWVMHDFAKRRGARMIWVKKRVVDGAFAEANLQQARELLALVEQEAAQRAVPREASPAF